MDYLLFLSSIFILVGSILISLKINFLQIKVLPNIFSIFRRSYAPLESTDRHTVRPHNALFTAMSTTLGTGTIVGPVLAICMGGPGALLGFLLSALLGSAATLVEVHLSIRMRKKLPHGEVLGGPMQYLSHILSPKVALWYSACCCLLMTAWSGAQANQLASILDSPLLGDYRIPTIASGILISVLVLITLSGGIHRLSALSSKLIPLIFTLYVGGCLWILFSHPEKLFVALGDIFSSAFTPYAMVSGGVVGGIVQALRWGVFKGLQATEAGIGTQAIPHAMAATNNSVEQGTLALVSTWTAGLVAFLTGCVVLTTNTWQQPELPLGMSMVAAAFQAHFSSFGIFIIVSSTILFAFGTIAGNSYNGSQCFRYFVDDRWQQLYFLITAFAIMLSSMADVKTFWSLIDVALAGIAIPHMYALLLHTYRDPSLSGNAMTKIIAAQE